MALLRVAPCALLLAGCSGVHGSSGAADATFADVGSILAAECAGCHVRIECGYDTRASDAPTPFAPTSEAEMCVNFLYATELP